LKRLENNWVMCPLKRQPTFICSWRYLVFG